MRVFCLRHDAGQPYYRVIRFNTDNLVPPLAMMTNKRHFESIDRAPRAHGIAMASDVLGTQCGLAMALQFEMNFAYSSANAGVVKTL